MYTKNCYTQLYCVQIDYQIFIGQRTYIIILNNFVVNCIQSAPMRKNYCHDYYAIIEFQVTALLP